MWGSLVNLRDTKRKITGEEYNMKISCNGEEFGSIKVFTERFGLSYEQYMKLKKRTIGDTYIISLAKGKTGTTKEGTGSVEGKRAVTDHKGTKFKSVKDMCDHYDIKKATYDYRLSIGMSLEEALTGEKRKAGRGVEDHNGNKFGSEMEMCNAYGIKTSTYCMRIKRGYSKKEALLGKDKKGTLMVV
jgi:hypothetical protein